MEEGRQRAEAGTGEAPLIPDPCSLYDPPMRIALGSDHAGFSLKEEIRSFLDRRGVEYGDFGAFSEQAVDYPDIAAAVATEVAGRQYQFGILVCGTGIGMSIAANKVPGVRAALAGDAETARLAREHNDANVLTLGGRVTPAARALEAVGAFLDAAFAGGRHQRRIDKITALERRRRD